MGTGQPRPPRFSAHSRPGLGVSMPVSWGKLSKLKSGPQWTIATAPEHHSFMTGDLWAGYWWPDRRSQSRWKSSVSTLHVDNDCISLRWLCVKATLEMRLFARRGRVLGTSATELVAIGYRIGSDRHRGRVQPLSLQPAPV